LNFPNEPVFPPATLRVPEGLAEDRLEISIEPDPAGDVRTVRLIGRGGRWHSALAEAAGRL